MLPQTGLRGWKRGAKGAEGDSVAKAMKGMTTFMPDPCEPFGFNSVAPPTLAEKFTECYLLISEASPQLKLKNVAL